MTVHSQLGQRIRQMREEKKLSQAELAQKAMIAQSTLSYIEAGKKSPTFETLRAIGDGLGVSIMDMLRFCDDETSNRPVESPDKALRDSLTEEELRQLINVSELIYKKFVKKPYDALRTSSRHGPSASLLHRLNECYDILSNQVENRLPIDEGVAKEWCGLDAAHFARALGQRPPACAGLRGVPRLAEKLPEKLYFGYSPSPYGRVLLAGNGQTIAYCAFCGPSGGLLSDLPDAVWDDAYALEAAAALFLHGQDFSPVLSGSRFEKDVLAALTRIPAGCTMSYAQLGELAGHKGCSRATGNALSRNRIVFAVPCHRVVRSDGGIGGFVGGVVRKRLMLLREASAAFCGS